MKISVDKIVSKLIFCRTSHVKSILSFRGISKSQKSLKAKVAFYHGNLMILLLNLLKISISEDGKMEDLPIRIAIFGVRRQRGRCLAKGVQGEGGERVNLFPELAR